MKSRARLPLILSASALLVPAAPAQDQVRFSVDWNSPVVSAPECDTGSVLITEADILTPCATGPMLGPIPSPRISITGGPGGLGLGLHPTCVGHPGGTICNIEVDALSFGMDPLITQAGFPAGSLWWSVDEYAGGVAGTPVPPNVLSEFPCGDAGGDLFAKTVPMVSGPVPPFAAPPDHVGVIDANGMDLGCTAFAYPGLGLREPNLPSFGPSTGGDNVDAFDDHEPGLPPVGAPYFSLDAGFPDPCAGIPGGSSALAHGFVGGDILTVVGGVPVVWGPAAGLGLDVFGPDTDDLDALAIFEDGDGVFDPSFGPFGWGPGAADMILFSVRRGSAVIGSIDSLLGLPIEEGDILIPPASPGAFPGIFVAAENLGLGTVRSATVSGACPGGDELDALDSHNSTLFDCNSNNIEDALDIAAGTSLDANSNGIPDECESPLLATSYCDCPNGGLCFNPYTPGGCENSTGLGSILSAAGTSDVVADDLVLTANQLPTFTLGIIYMGTLQVGPIPFGDGLRCVGGNICRFPIQSSGAAGVMTEGPGIVFDSIGLGCPINAGDTWNFQCWYRDPGGPCGNGFNFSNAVSVDFY